MHHNAPQCTIHIGSPALADPLPYTALTPKPSPPAPCLPSKPPAPFTTGMGSGWFDLHCSQASKQWTLGSLGGLAVTSFGPGASITVDKRLLASCCRDFEALAANPCSAKAGGGVPQHARVDDEAREGGAQHARVDDEAGEGGAQHARVDDEAGEGGAQHGRVDDEAGEGGAQHGRVDDEAGVPYGRADWDLSGGCPPPHV